MKGVLSLPDFSEMRFSRDSDQIIHLNISTKFLPGILVGYAADVSIGTT